MNTEESRAVPAVYRSIDFKTYDDRSVDFCAALSAVMEQFKDLDPVSRDAGLQWFASKYNLRTALRT